MASVGWLTRSLADVPADDGWLGPRERDVLASLTVAKRRQDWRLGRFAAKGAVAEWLGLPLARLEIVAAADGAPEAYVDDRAAPAAVSLSHRAGRALAVAGEAGMSLGCDLELIEPRSHGFVTDWLAPAEQALVADAGGRRDLVANLAWSAKEAAAKARREGLRLDLRQAVTESGGLDTDSPGWRPLSVLWADGSGSTRGWWREEPGWVMTVAGEPAPGRPRPLEGP
jgi:4'-phosphopantetheinyl transferase